MVAALCSLLSMSLLQIALACGGTTGRLWNTIAVTVLVVRDVQ